MADLFIRGVPEEVLAAIDRKARRAGISRSEFLHQALLREGADESTTLTVDDLKRFSDRFADLADVDVMRDAWS